MLGVATRRLFEMAGSTEDSREVASLLSALGLAATRRASLMRAQHIIGNSRDEVREAISLGLMKVRHELKPSN